jgi:phosphoribosylaminoimidazolecarboxamide formyltransferase/IMP cyclohydrolase
MSDKTKDPLASQNIGDHPVGTSVDGIVYSKVRDLRYGTNPTQTAALYNNLSFLGKLRELKTGKEGPSQTNFEDILYAALSVMYFDDPTAAIMKHENECGFATQYEPEPLHLTYRKAFDPDFRAAFGGTVFINRPIDKNTSEAIKELFTEVIVAPGFDEGVVGSFKGSVRIFEYDKDAYKSIPKFTGDKFVPEVKRLQDGSVIMADPLLTPIRTIEDLRPHIVSKKKPSDNELRDLLTGYRLRIRSNSVRMVKNGYTTGIGTGQQDRVMCIDIAAYKSRKIQALAEKEGRKRVADYGIAGSSLASDGFFPFTDSIELAHELGITAVLAPHGGKNFDDVKKKADELGIAFVDLPGDLRFFDHH